MKQCLLFLLAFLIQTAWGNIPHIGYIYPAGGQTETVFQAEIGGQYLENFKAVHITGGNVHVQILNYAITYDQKRLNQLLRSKKNILATLADPKTKDQKKITQMKRRLKKIEHDLALGNFPPNFDFKNRKMIRKFYSTRKKNQFNPQLAGRLHLKITIDSNAKPGIRELRLETTQGLSNPIYFKVGTLPEHLETEPNDDHLAPTLQTVLPPCIINGQIMPGDIDHIRFTAQKGQHIVINVAARKITPYLADAVPGWFQAVVALYDEEGNEVAYQDDYKFNPDPVLFFNVPKTGKYVLSIKDAIYRGREDFVYRIAIGELPFITSIFPLGAQEGQKINIALSGWNLPTNQISGQLLEGGGTVRHITVEKQGYRSNPLPFIIGTLPETQETQTNHTPQTAQKIDFPQIINGRIQNPNEHDYYTFYGKAGTTISIETQARRLGSPLDSIIQLTGPGLPHPISNDDYMLEDSTHLHLGAGLLTHYADSYILQTLPSNGLYTVNIGDTQAKSGSDYSYRLRIAPSHPDYTLRLEPSGQQIAPGATALFTIRVLRTEGFSQPIHLSVTNLPPGFIIHGTQIPTNATLTQLTITAPKKIEQQTIAPIVIGQAQLNGKTLRKTAIPVDDQMQAFLYRHLVPAKQLTLNPSSIPAPLTFHVKPPKSGRINIPLKKETRIIFIGKWNKRFKGAKLQLDHPPKGIKLIKGWIGPRRIKGKTKNGKPRFAKHELWGQIIIQADAPLKPGDTLTLVVSAHIKKGKNNIKQYPAPAFNIHIIKIPKQN